MRSEINKQHLLMAVLVAGFALLIIGAFYAPTKRVVEDWRHQETVKLTVTRREKAKLAIGVDPRYLFANDLERPDAFYVKTTERGWLRTDINTYGVIGRGKMEMDITRRNGEPVILEARWP